MHPLRWEWTSTSALLSQSAKMCVAFTSNAEKHELGLFSEVDFAEGWVVGLVRPTDPAPILVSVVAGLRWQTLRWGFKGHSRAPLVNARLETVYELPSFRQEARESRCLIPVRTFYEWEDTGAKRKAPWCFRDPDNGLLWVAGIFRPQEQTFCMVTTEPNRFVADVHDRMPALLSLEAVMAWLGNGMYDSAVVPLAREEKDPFGSQRKQGTLF